MLNGIIGQGLPIGCFTLLGTLKSCITTLLKGFHSNLCWSAMNALLIVNAATTPLSNRHAKRVTTAVYFEAQ